MLAIAARTIQGQDGSILSGAEVTVRVHDTDALADIYTDRAGTTPAANPLTASVTGTVQFFAVPGVYRLEATGAGGAETQVVDLTGIPVIPVASIAALAALDTAALPDGQQASVREYHAGTARGGRTMVWDSASVADANGGTVIAPDSGDGRWLWIEQGEISAELFGARCDGSSDDTAAWTAAITEVSNRGGGLVRWTGDSFVSGITLPTGVVLQGEGPTRSRLYMLDGANATVVKSENFDTLTGTNSWFIDSEGVPHNFGLRECSIWGNRGNTAGSGVEFYGKRYIVDNVYVSQCKEHGFWSEAGSKGGQNDPVFDQPECFIARLNIRECEKDGFHYEGPHDGRIESVVASNCGWRCVAFVKGENSGPTCDVGFIHSYGSGKDIDTNNYISEFASTYIGGAIRVSEIVAESAATNALLVDEGGNGTQIGIIRTFQNDFLDAGHAAIRIDGNDCSIDNIRSTSTNNSGGVLVNGRGARLAGRVLGAGSSGTGIEIDASLSDIDLEVFGFNGVGGLGLKTTGGNRNRVTVTMVGVYSGWENISPGMANVYNVNIRSDSDGNRFVGNGPSDGDVWNVFAELDNDFGQRYSKTTTKAGADVDLNTTSVQVISFNHDLLDGLTPNIESISLGLVEHTNFQNYRLDFMYVSGLSTTQITVRLKLGVATTDPATARLVASYSV